MAPAPFARPSDHEAPSALLRVAVVDLDEARRVRLCAALVGDPRVGALHGFGTAPDVHRIPRLGVDVVIVSAAGTEQALALVDAVRHAEGDAAVVAVVHELARPGDEALTRLLARADDLVLGGSVRDGTYAIRQRLFCAFDRVRAANDAGAGPSLRARVRLLVVVGGDSGTLARAQLAVRGAGPGCPAVVLVAPSNPASPEPVDDVALGPGRAIRVAPGGRVLRCGEDLRWRATRCESAHAAQVQLVDSALDACGPGVAVLCVEPASVAALARRRLLNDGARLRRCDPRRLEAALAELLWTAGLDPVTASPQSAAIALQ